MPGAAQCQLVPTDNLEDSGEENEEQEKKGGGLSKRKRLSIYQKMLAIREVDKLIESGVRHAIEKKVMKQFPDLFMGTTGSYKSGMLGRWLTQCDDEGWRSIPWEKMGKEDRDSIKELPDWVRVPMGLFPRSLERFKAGRNVPPCIVKSLVTMIERVTCGGSTANLTAGTLKTKSIQADCQKMLDDYHEAQVKACQEKGMPVPDAKLTVTTKWVNRLLETYGWRRNAPNTYGAYLEYDDQRMERSRRSWKFLRLVTIDGICFKDGQKHEHFCSFSHIHLPLLTGCVKTINQSH